MKCEAPNKWLQHPFGFVEQSRKMLTAAADKQQYLLQQSFTKSPVYSVAGCRRGCCYGYGAVFATYLTGIVQTVPTKRSKDVCQIKINLKESALTMFFFLS